MQAWWETLTSIQHFFYFIAIPSTVILLLQFALTLLGMGGSGDADFDFDSDIEVFEPSDSAMDDILVASDFRFVSFRGIIAFLTIFGWTGQVLSQTDLHVAIILLIATLAGLLAMFLVAYLFYAISRLQSSGNISYKNALGHTGEVYIPIPSLNQGRGKIQITVQERLIEIEAITFGEKAFRTGDLVRVVDVINATIMVVEPVDH